MTRVVYLGGLGDERSAEHLRRATRSRSCWRSACAELVHVRAAMIIGPGSASWEMLRHLTLRLPVMITPRWLDTRSQPMAIADVARALADVGELDEVPAETQLGGADVLTYREMIQRTAKALGRRPLKVITVPVL